MRPQQQPTTDEWVRDLSEDATQIAYLNDELLDDLVCVLEARQRQPDAAAVVRLVGAVVAAGAIPLTIGGRRLQGDQQNARCWLSELFDPPAIEEVLGKLNRGTVRSRRGRKTQVPANN